MFTNRMNNIMFDSRMQPCAAGDRCCLKPKLADPQHKCPVCRRHIHALCGVVDLHADNHMNSRICYDCLSKLTSPSEPSATSSPSEPSVTTSPSEPLSSSATSDYSSSITLAQNYFDSMLAIDDNPDAASQILISMAVCLSKDELQQEKIDSLVKNKIVTKSSTTPGKDYLKKEIARRVVLINKREEEDGVPPKKLTKNAKTKNWSKPKLITWLCNHPLLSAEKAWVVKNVNDFIVKVQDDANKKEEEKKQSGGSVNRATKLKMRLFEACFLDEFRDSLIRMYDSKSRQELDARNSERRPKTFFEMVCQKYNDAGWVPVSTIFDEFHHEFSVSFPLPLYRNDGQEEKREAKLTVEKAK